jgi:hypothetical protein
MVDRMRATRRPGECYSEVISRLVALAIDFGERVDPSNWVKE